MKTKRLTVDAETGLAFAPRGKYAYVLHGTNGQTSVCFIRDPEIRGYWLKTHPCVLLADCWCGAQIGEPCIGQYERRTASHHSDRVQRAEKTGKKLRGRHGALVPL